MTEKNFMPELDNKVENPTKGTEALIPKKFLETLKKVTFDFTAGLLKTMELDNQWEFEVNPRFDKNKIETLFSPIDEKPPKSTLLDKIENLPLNTNLVPIDEEEPTLDAVAEIELKVESKVELEIEESIPQTAQVFSAKYEKASVMEAHKANAIAKSKKPEEVLKIIADHEIEPKTFNIGVAGLKDETEITEKQRLLFQKVVGIKEEVPAQEILEVIAKTEEDILPEAQTLALAQEVLTPVEFQLETIVEPILKIEPLAFAPETIAIPIMQETIIEQPIVPVVSNFTEQTLVPDFMPINSGITPETFSQDSLTKAVGSLGLTSYLPQSQAQFVPSFGSGYSSLPLAV